MILKWFLLIKLMNIWILDQIWYFRIQFFNVCWFLILILKWKSQLHNSDPLIAFDDNYTLWHPEYWFCTKRWASWQVWFMHILAWIYLSVFWGYYFIIFHLVWWPVTKPFLLMQSHCQIIAMESYGEIQLYPISFLKKKTCTLKLTFWGPSPRKMFLTFRRVPPN